MRKTVKMLTFVGILAFANPANAAVLIDATDVGKTFTINYEGKVAGSMTPLISAVQQFTFTGTSNSNSTYNFSYTLTNDSINESRIRSFGFDVTSPNTITSFAATGAYPFSEANNNFPEALGVREICFRASGGNNCTGGPNGLTKGQSGMGTFSIDFANPANSIELGNFATRFQSIDPGIFGSTSGVGVGVVDMNAVPEPATWAFMIFGFGAIGGAMRRQRKIQTGFSRA